MAYIDRENGVIVGCFALSQYEGQEQINDDSEELLAFLAPRLNPLDQLEMLITQGQNAMAKAPLPEDIQKQIYDLEPFVQNYYKRGAMQLITDTISAFVIPEDDERVTLDQRTQVENLKNAMLAVFNDV